ncbi:hypothetical protein OGAPHI_003084 [Ogataea philodendri]|uniref:SBE2/SBE22 middle domain-containing protein n=1 Tax=Ogataea philodendri TaxID=1378263 RepID=A0A9P8P9F2_9ASCO|nr:uncharacterized protein OGAPHI_003084 [Ogataea philodendri]KAH3667435.1 hypothetical protein OGAPHI_003084 [Ogataea philodendri]
MPSFSGLGIKRPSDSVLNISKHDSTTGDSSGDSNGSTSRVSSITSVSSTELPRTNIKVPPPRASRIAKTMSQQEKYKLYEELENDDKIPDESSMFNVPLAMHSTASLFEHTSRDSGSHILKRAWKDSSKIVPSPLPGALAQESRTEPTYLPSPTLTKHYSYTTLSPDARQLTGFYEYSVQNHVEKELNRRSKYSSKVDILDDPTLVSSEKADSLTMTRPSWLPPKNKHESLKHEKEFTKMVEKYGLHHRKESARAEQRERDRMIGDARLTYFAGKTKIKSSNWAEIKKLMWRTQVDAATRYTIFVKVLEHRQFSVEVPTLSPTTRNLDLDSFISSHPDIYKQPKLFASLDKLLRITSAQQDWQLNSYHVNLALLTNGFSFSRSLKTLYFLNKHIVTKEFVTKFNAIQSHPYMKSSLKSFKDDLNLVTFDAFMKIMKNFSLPMVFKLVSLLMVYGDYKLLYACVLTVLLHYHFGWNNLQLVLHNSDPMIRIPDEEVFWSRVYSYYKKM